MVNGENGRWYVVGGRWGKNRSRESGVRSQSEEHLLPAFCRLPTASEGGRTGGTLGPYLRLRQDVTADMEIKKQ
jgi:hypothetical protein